MIRPRSNRKRTRYTYYVIWSVEDQENVGLCLEFPLLFWLASTPVKAVLGIDDLVWKVVREMEDSDQEPPVPLATRIELQRIDNARRSSNQKAKSKVRHH